MAGRIEDYGFIGNLRTGALCSRFGSIDWLCAPNFDSDACFTSLLGYDEHGHWALRPTRALRETQQRYRGDTLILETEFVCDGGRVRISDFMPLATDSRCDIVRVVEGLEGAVPLEMSLDVRFGYGTASPVVHYESGAVRFVAGPDAVTLRLPLEPHEQDGRIRAYFEVEQGKRIAFQLAWHPSYMASPAALDVDAALAQTEAYWRDWAGRCKYTGAYRDAVLRSLITLKGMIFEPTGGIVAAPTTSLPECIGGVRNWDYRYSWLRDASLTLDALMIGGYLDEARSFRSWLLRAVAGAPEQLQIMYSISGARRLTEFELPWLPGYEDSRPVRVGNSASNQFQLDVYGEFLSSMYAARRLGLDQSNETWLPLRALIRFLEQAWQRPDDGIWEVRGGRRHFTHSKVMAWVAIDRIVRAIQEFKIGDAEGQSMLPHLGALRERMHGEICQRGFNPRVGAFTQSYGSEALDASLLTIAHSGFLPPSDPRVIGTVHAIEKTLLRDGFVLRYDTRSGADGLPGDEGAFLACSFWLADNYAFMGRFDEAEALFERLLGLRNHLGLLAEEYDPRLGRQIGNFPQAFSHLALISTAQAITVGRERAAHQLPLQPPGISPLTAIEPAAPAR